MALAKQLAQLARADPQPTREAIDETVKKAAALLLEIVNDVHATHTASEHNFRSLCALIQLEATTDEVLFHIATCVECLVAHFDYHMWIKRSCADSVVVFSQW